MALVRLDPWRDFRRGFRGSDRFFDDFHNAYPWPRSLRFKGGNLALDVIDEDNQFIVAASLPGFAPGDVDVSITDRIVTVTAESKDDGASGRGEDAYVLRERHFGKLSRSVMLPDEVDADHAVAEHKDGVLTLTLPKTIVERTKKVPIKTG